jgi:predicted transcriptional regulator
MDLSLGDISTLVFKRVVRDDLGGVSLDSRMLNVFMELDGKTTLDTVAQKAGLNMGAMREIISKLLEIGIIEKVEKQIRFLDKDFIEYLLKQFSLAVGPIAEVLIEDEVRLLGYDLSRFPAQRVAELVDRLCQEIRRREKQSVFKRNMINMIRQKKYFNT